MTKDYGLVSIITPTYNCGKFIAETIRCVLAQTYRRWEMIIVDDCSTDRTREAVAPFLSDLRIHYMENKTNCGAAVSRNLALRMAKGKWIAFLDSDDLWLPGKLERQLRFMSSHGYAFSYHEYDEIDEDSVPVGVHVSGLAKVGKWQMYSCCWPGCLSVMYDAEKVGLIQIADVKKDNDSAMWLKVSQKYDCHLLREPLAYYRRRRGGITPTSLAAKIWWHYILFRQGEGMNPVASLFWMCANVLGNACKKAFYVRKIETADNNVVDDCCARNVEMIDKVNDYDEEEYTVFPSGHVGRRSKARV